ncbi:DNA-directed RNA polymerase subunit A', partial [Candidatus Woesearchaeota archaeon]|nr:DNA-directed RNA polymerase subunit A' [Candidatus Woesearchaeota archaeon]
YNADFDGDEMNLHIPQTEEARAEAEVLMEVQTQLISPGYGLAVVGCLLDSITGSYLLTQDGTSLPRNEAIDLLTQSGVADFSRLPDKNVVSGKEIFSVLLPEDLTFVGKSLDRKEIIIKAGNIEKGVMDNASLGGGKGLLLRALHKQYGADRAIDLLQKFSRLGAAYTTYYGFSTGIADADLPQDATTMIADTLSTAERAVENVIREYESGELEAFPGRSTAETVELRILELLNKARNKAGDIVAQHARKDVGTHIMAASGAKGNPLNLAQIAANVGQQALRGKRIDQGYSDRTLSCFRKNDRSPEARGFIRAGFKHGLNPKEFFMGNITGRDSLMDTALRTPKSGYLYRRLANALQDLRVEHDGTVREAGGKIIQFRYGEDGIDVAKSENGKINVKKIVESI